MILDDNLITIQQSISSVEPNFIVIDENYLEILEKTNQQLGLWSNPYGMMVGILTIIVGLLTLFVGVAAIITTIYLYRQGRDYRKKLTDDHKTRKQEVDEALGEIKKTAEKINKETQKKVDAINDKNKKVAKGELRRLKAAWKKKLKEQQSITEENKKDIERAIREIDTKLAMVDAAFPLSTGGLMIDTEALTTLAGEYNNSIDWQTRASDVMYPLKTISTPKPFTIADEIFSDRVTPRVLGICQNCFCVNNSCQCLPDSKI